MESKEILKNIGKNIDNIRIQKNMTAAEFAIYIKAPKTQVLNVIKGERGFSITKLFEISEITNVPINFILTGEKLTIEQEVKKRLLSVEDDLKKVVDNISNIMAVVKK